MLDRVRQALFSFLGERCDGERVLDLFSGTGSLGIEALSRGAAFARFLERDPRAFRVLEKNLASLELKARAQASRSDALDARAWDANQPYDLVFFDPPYPMLDDPRTKKHLFDALVRLGGQALAPAGKIVFHAPKGRFFEREFQPAFQVQLREYGSNAIWYLSPDTMATP